MRRAAPACHSGRGTTTRSSAEKFSRFAESFGDTEGVITATALIDALNWPT
jgi:hypothetical protein